MVQQAVGKMFCSSPKGSAKAAGLSRRVPMVSNSDEGSLDTAQWNLVMAVHGEGGIDLPKPCLRRVGAVIAEGHKAVEIKNVERFGHGFTEF